MGLCFVGLSTFVVEFAISFFAFCCFFYFMLNSELKKFIDITHTVENTLTMAIGKFNFADLKNVLYLPLIIKGGLGHFKSAESLSQTY